MSPELVGLIGLIVLFIFLFMGMPIGGALALVGFLGFWFLSGFSQAAYMVATVPYSTIAAYLFSVVPMFLLMGEYVSLSGLMTDGYRGIHTLLGHLPGGLAMATIGGCAGFAACVGSSLPAIATMTRISLPEMLEYKYDRGLATATIAAGGTLGILIPPSIPLVLFGVITETSIGTLLIAGIVPGILLTFLLMANIYIRARLNPSLAPPGPSSSWRQRIVALKDIWGIVFIFLLVMGGIWGGIFTPTEAGAMGALGAIVFALAKRKVTWQNIVPTFLAALRTTGLGIFLVIGAFIFTYFVSVSRLSVFLCETLAALPIPPLAIMGAIILLYLILGCIMESITMMLLTVPILYPVVQALGYDIVWYAILLTIMCETALITPPIGLNVFVMAGMRRDIPMGTIFRGLFPFVGTMLLCVLLVLLFPQIALWLPDTMVSMR